MWRCVLEPGQKVEVAAEIATVIEAASDGGQELHADGDVSRALLEDLPPPVLKWR
jgi:hypothetical protein